MPQGACNGRCHSEKKPALPSRDAGFSVSTAASTHQLPGQGHLDGIPILVQHVQPDSGMSPLVDWATAIFLAMSSRQAIWALPR
jgi:hypothetical protein